MERGGGGRRSPFGFGDPFAGFGALGGGRGSLISGFFGGRNPFDDDPFFARPPFFGQDPFFGRPFGGLLGPGMFDHGVVRGPAARPQNQSRGPVIEEIGGSDDDDDEERNGGDGEQIKRPRKLSRSSDEPWVQHPDDGLGDRRSKQAQIERYYGNMNRVNPQAQTFSFQSSTVTYGGANGAYYTSSSTRRMGGDGVVFEESKEADSTSGRASHRISRGIGDKGHSISRKLNTDGKVDTMQTLHNLNEDELDVFEKAWGGNAKKYLPGMEGFNMNHHGAGESSSRQNGQGSRGWALPSTEQPQRQERTTPQFNMQGRASVDNLESVRPHTHGKRNFSSAKK